MLDLFIVIVVLWALYSGWRNGLLREIASGIGFFVGLVVAATCYSSFGKYLAVNGSETNMVTSIVAFFILWIIVPIALGMVAVILSKILDAIYLGVANRAAGAAVSLLKFGILLSCALSVMSALGILNEERTESSVVYPVAKGFAGDVINWVIGDAKAVSNGAESGGEVEAQGDSIHWIEVHHDNNQAE